jgi:hypothetical protein
MPSDPGQPPSPERPQSVGGEDRKSAASGGHDDVALGAEERCGPLTITRVVKDDGRSLILYGHAESQAELAQPVLDDTAAAEPEHAAGPERGDGPA